MSKNASASNERRLAMLFRTPMFFEAMPQSMHQTTRYNLPADSQTQCSLRHWTARTRTVFFVISFMLFATMFVWFVIEWWLTAAKLRDSFYSSKHFLKFFSCASEFLYYRIISGRLSGVNTGKWCLMPADFSRWALSLRYRQKMAVSFVLHDCLNVR